MARPESEDILIIDDTWHGGVSVHVIDGMESEDGFDSVEDAYDYACDLMDRHKFYPTVWVQYDQCDPMPYDGGLRA